MRRRALAVVVLAMAASGASADIFIVRHAEKQSPKMDHSLLSSVGHKRAKSLAKVLRDIDLRAVYCTEYERTCQTATPTADAHQLPLTKTDSEDVKGLAKALLQRPMSEDVLVVGHSDTVPDLLVELGVSTRVAIGSNDFDNLFVVTRSSGSAPTLHRLHY